MAWKLREQKEELKKLQESIQAGKNYSKKITQLLRKIHSNRYDDLIKQSLAALMQGEVTLTVNDYYQFWTNLHIDNDIIFFRCTSKIDPKLWMTPDMQLYEKRQVANIMSYHQNDSKEKRKLAKIIEKKLRTIKYDGNNNFERIFILDEVQRNKDSVVDDLASVIGRQVKNGIKVKAICIKSNERPTFMRPQDFGILLTENSDKLLMYLEVGTKGEQEGGQIIFDEEDIAEFEKHYAKIEQKAQFIKTVEPEKIKKTIRQLRSVDISDIFGIRCYQCLLDAEQKVDSGEWKHDKTPKRIWYQIVKDENEALYNILQDEKPRSVLEIGCGPGRVIRQALKLKDKIDLARVEGYEQNPDICSLAMERLKDVKIFPVLVGEDKKGKWHPIRSDHTNRFDMVFAVSNIVGWQMNEERWIREILRAGRSLFFTVYKRSFQLERARMYKASGDLFTFTNKDQQNIELVVDAFHGERHVTKAYTKSEIEAIVEDVAKKVPLSHKEIKGVGKYMWGCLLKKKD